MDFKTVKIFVEPNNLYILINYVVKNFGMFFNRFTRQWDGQRRINETRRDHAYQTTIDYTTVTVLSHLR